MKDQTTAKIEKISMNLI